MNGRTHLWCGTGDNWLHSTAAYLANDPAVEVLVAVNCVLFYTVATVGLVMLHGFVQNTSKHDELADFPNAEDHEECSSERTVGQSFNSQTEPPGWWPYFGTLTLWVPIMVALSIPSMFFTLSKSIPNDNTLDLNEGFLAVRTTSSSLQQHIYACVFLKIAMPYAGVSICHWPYQFWHIVHHTNHCKHSL